MSLPALAQRIDAAHDLDEVMLVLADAIRAHCGADRATVYAIGEDRASLVSKIRTGAGAYTQLKLPISAHSIAGYVALSRRVLNLRDVYDEAELRAHAQDLRFQHGVDRRTGYRTREMLAAPILGDGEVVGVLQLINNQHGGAFGAQVIADVSMLCERLAAVLQRHQAPAPRERAGFARNLQAGQVSRAEIEEAVRTAQAGGRDIEEVLLGEFGLKPAAIGRALSDYFGVPYVAYHPQRMRPDALLAGVDRAGAAAAQWLPLGASRHSVYVVCTDPGVTAAGSSVRAAFPGLKPVLCVTTRREFAAMLEHCFAVRTATLPEDVVEMVTGMVAGTARHGVSNLRIETVPGEREGEIRFTVSGTLRLP